MLEDNSPKICIPYSPNIHNKYFIIILIYAFLLKTSIHFNY